MRQVLEGAFVVNQQFRTSGGNETKNEPPLPSTQTLSPVIFAYSRSYSAMCKRGGHAGSHENAVKYYVHSTSPMFLNRAHIDRHSNSIAYELEFFNRGWIRNCTSFSFVSLSSSPHKISLWQDIPVL